jgi:CYTH domain-containing protein/CHAD domain-containing protein
LDGCSSPLILAAAYDPCVAEIERKFLVDEMPRAESSRTEIEQGYLAIDEGAEVRLRRAGSELFLTAKSGHGEVREEVEVTIAPGPFEELWPLTADRRVRKVRHYVPLGGGLRAELDVYGDELDGLRTVEVEFGSDEEADRFAIPHWFGRELTGDARYANQSLATSGLPPEVRKDQDAGKENAMSTDPPERPGTEPDSPTPSRAYRLNGDEDAAAEVRRVIVGRLEKAAERLREPSEGDELAEAIHGARKDLKKARAALRLVREELGEETFKRENRALRDAGRMLSASRDAEVKLATLDSLGKDESGDLPPGPTALWREALLADRDRIVDADADQTGGATEAIEAVTARAREWRIRHSGWKRGKDLWYQVRLLRDAWPAILEATAEEIHEFTDFLGDHHDLAVLAEDLADRDAVDAAHRPILMALIEARQASLLADAVSAGERIYAEKPKAFGRRLRAYWRAWRRPTN